jgi:hypothetical protein
VNPAAALSAQKCDDPIILTDRPEVGIEQQTGNPEYPVDSTWRPVLFSPVC